MIRSRGAIHAKMSKLVNRLNTGKPLGQTRVRLRLTVLQNPEGIARVVEIAASGHTMQ